MRRAHAVVISGTATLTEVAGVVVDAPGDVLPALIVVLEVDAAGNGRRRAFEGRALVASWHLGVGVTANQRDKKTKT